MSSKIGRGIVLGVSVLLMVVSSPPAWAMDGNRMMQSCLKAVGYYQGPVHGQLDAATLAAAIRWSQARGINFVQDSQGAALQLMLECAEKNPPLVNSFLPR